MGKLLIGGLILAGALCVMGSPGGMLRHSGGSGLGTGGAGIKSYATSSGNAVRGIGSAATGILK